MSKINIVDSTLCCENGNYSFKEKMEIVRQLDKAGVDVIELPKINNLREDTLFIKTVSTSLKSSVLSINAGLTNESVDVASEVASYSDNSILRIEVPVSPVGMEYIVHKKGPKFLDFISSIITYAKSKGRRVAFCALDATRCEKDNLLEIFKTAKDSGADCITIYDSSAEMFPEDFASLVKFLSQQLNTNIGVYCSDKNGLGLANGVLALRNGAVMVKTAIGGEGISLKLLANLLKNNSQNYHLECNINFTEIERIIKQISRFGKQEDSTKKTCLGITTEENKIFLSKDDSLEDVKRSILTLGYDLPDEDVKKVYDEFLIVASKKDVGARELDAIIASCAMQVPSTYSLISYIINNGNIIKSTAQITLSKNGEILQGVKIGDGPIDAAFVTIEDIVGRHFELDDFQIQSITEGKEALGSAFVKLRANGKVYSGNGVSSDIIGASIRAYLSAINKIIYEE